MIYPPQKNTFYFNVSFICITSSSSKLNHSPLILLVLYTLWSADSMASAINRVGYSLDAIKSIVGLSLYNVCSLYLGLLDIPIL